MMLLGKLCILTVILSFILKAEGHGWMEDPLPRNGRFNEMNCGGYARQHYYNNGKCGICGDSYTSNPRRHETSATRKFPVVKSYLSGDIINMRTIINANHLGTVEVKVCPATDPNVEVTQECLDQNILEILPNTRTIDNDKYRVKVFASDGDFTVRVKLPDGLTCSRCVLQWKYRSGNTHGVFENGTRILGVGPQEEFINCADIEIKPNPNKPQIAYVPKPLEPPRNDLPIVYTCATYGTPPPRNTNPDIYRYKGAGFICYWLKGTLSSNSVERLAQCDSCRQLCSYPETVCPDHCQCYWYGPVQNRTTTSTTTTSTTTLKPTTVTTKLTTVTTTTSVSNKPTVRYLCSKNQAPPKTNKTNSLIYKGSAVICYSPLPNEKPIDCDVCKNNCLSPDTKCPDELCDCRWYM